MTEDEKSLLRRKWEYKNEFRTFGNVIGKMEGFGIIDLRTEGVLILRDNLGELTYSLVDRNLDIASPPNSKNIVRLRIGDLTADKLTLIVSAKKEEENDGNFSKEIVELTYRPVDE
jgi:hypothetical protein